MSVVMLSDATTLRLEKVAEAEGTSASELAERALQQFLRDEARRLLHKEAEAFRAMHADLLARFAGEYVAMYQGRVVDHDTDQLALLLRMEEHYPNTPVLIKPVRPEIDEVFTIRSPRISYGR